MRVALRYASTPESYRARNDEAREPLPSSPHLLRSRPSLLTLASLARRYRGTSIDCCKQVILQGRCTLVIMLQIYKILGVNCLVTALILSRLTIMGVKQGDMQMTITGLIVAGFFFLISLAKPLKTLSPRRPPASVLTIKSLLSIGAQVSPAAGGGAGGDSVLTLARSVRRPLQHHHGRHPRLHALPRPRRHLQHARRAL